MPLENPLQQNALQGSIPQAAVDALSAALKRLATISSNPDIPKDQLRTMTYRDQLGLNIIAGPPHLGGLPQLDQKHPQYFEDILQRAVLSSSIMALDAGINSKYPHRAELANRTKELLSSWVRMRGIPVDERLLSPKSSLGSESAQLPSEPKRAQIPLTPALREFSETLSTTLSTAAFPRLPEPVRKDLVEKSLAAIRSMNNGRLPERDPAHFEQIETQRRIETALSWVRTSSPELGIDTLQAVAREIQRGTGFDFGKSGLSGQLRGLVLPFRSK